MTGPYPHARPGSALRCAPTLLLLLALPVALVGCAETSPGPDRADGGPVGDDDDDDDMAVGDDDDDDADACDRTTPCGDDQFCDVDPATCGGPQGSGTCEQRPEVCTDDCPGVCGCDGMSYCNACQAQAAGVDVSNDDSCLDDACDAQDADAVGPCDAFFGVGWDGSECVGLSGCACVGVDCDALFESMEACETAFSDCLS